jgi:hypothetical protein
METLRVTIESLPVVPPDLDRRADASTLGATAGPTRRRRTLYLALARYVLKIAGN